ncbi:unnamed protein product, partial [Rotaria sp. Silwood1]
WEHAPGDARRRRIL